MNTTPVNFKPVGILPLLKSTNATNFIYEIENPILSENEFPELDLVNIYYKRDLTRDEGSSIKFSDIEGKLFKNNLILVDSLLPQILGEIILYSYKTNEYKLPYLLNDIEQMNPLQISGFKNIKFYTYKFRQLLNHLILGMQPSVVWHGEPNIYEHYPIIKNNDEIIYYTDNVHIFTDLIIKNTVLTLSQSDENVYYRSGKLYLKINLQLDYV